MDAFARVLAEPGSMAARRALLADWKARDDPRAELLENQLTYLELARAGSDRAYALRLAINVAIGKRGWAWAGELAKIVTDYKFHRGLVAEITISGADFVARAPRLFELAPIQHVTITAPLPSVDALFSVPQLAKLTSLNMPLLGAAFGDAGAFALARCEHAARLGWISLNYDEIGQSGVEALAESPMLAHARFLGLKGNAVDPTPYVQEVMEGLYGGGRPSLAAALEQRFGPRPWLTTPTNPEDWPPEREALAIT
ncbi:hypothetical protein [Pyxidicoccus trucidator]|uniref:hypothetical protein n=1 Tax=Pyxidicoccus trucidator TaxID=2709662 RepID=UPI0013DCFA90|nr:hypothetical protein [Pyxidicoccus trucidator]